MTTEVVAADVSASGRSRPCAKTGLRLRPATGDTIWRVQKTSYGAANPRVPKPDDDPAEWGRWDVVGHRTIYGGGSQAGALVETLQDFRIVKSTSPPLRELFDHVPNNTTLLDAIHAEWASDWGNFTPGKIPKTWRESRNLYELQVPTKGWFIEIDHADSITAMAVGLRDELETLGVHQLTVQQLYEDDRRLRLTSTIADWIWHQVLDDGSLPVGIHYHSKWGANYDCFAVWLRAIDDGKPSNSEPTKLLNSHCINCADPWVEEAARVHGLTVF